MNRKLSILILIVLLRFTFVQAQVLPLDSVLSFIDRNNPALQEYDSKVKALNAYSEGAKSWMAPMVGAGTFMTPYPGQGVTEGRDKGFIMISMEQNIPNPSKLNANKMYLQSKASIETEGRAYTYNTLRSNAKTAYYQWLILEKKVKVLHESQTILQLMLKLAQIRYPYNQGSLGNIYKAQARLHEIENMMLMTHAEIDDKSSVLKSMMNLPSNVPIAIDTNTSVTFKAIDLQSDTIELRSLRSDVKQIDKTIQSMQYNLQLQDYQARPDFKIRFDHMSPLGNSMPTQFTLMGMVSIPIAPWSSKMYKSETKGMQYDIDAMKKSREAILNETRGKLVGTAAHIRHFQQQVTNYETKIIPALRKNYETLMLAYEENREQLPIVIDGWEALNMAQLESFNKLEDYYLIIVDYEKELEK